MSGEDFKNGDFCVDLVFSVAEIAIIRVFPRLLEIKRKKVIDTGLFGFFKDFGRSYWTVSLDIGRFEKETLPINFLNQMYR
jgi:hypothetical protein